jgi:hypothetical protein
MSGQIFISYRRDDTRWVVTSLCKSLIPPFTTDQIFYDIDNIDAGVDFAKVIDDAISKCDVLLAVIGKSWLHHKDKNGKRKLDDPSDFVRIEIAAALKRDICVIPVLADSATMPAAEELPPNLKMLARRNAIELSHHRFSADIDRLIATIQKAIKTEPPAPLPGTADLAEENRYWEYAIKENSLTSYQTYLNNSKLGLHNEEANKRFLALKQRTENDSWQKALTANSLDGFQHYLLEYPAGFYADNARQMITVLESEEDIAWRKTSGKPNRKLYQQYLQTYPSGTYRDEALTGIKKQKRRGVILICILSLVVLTAGTAGWNYWQKNTEAKKAKEMEEAQWQTALQQNDTAAYQQYLTHFPAGAFSVLAL